MHFVGRIDSPLTHGLGKTVNVGLQIGLLSLKILPIPEVVQPAFSEAILFVFLPFGQI